MCAAQKGHQELRLREEGGSPVPAHALLQEIGLISNGIQPLNVSQFHFGSHSRSNEPIFLCQQGTRHYHGVQSVAAAGAFQSIAPPEAPAAKHLTPGPLPSSQKSIISHRKCAPFPWIRFGPRGADAVVLVANAESKTAAKQRALKVGLNRHLLFIR